ncbi:MAG TPA: hypothetical protein VM537_03965, partial [Anaerolineae bacterium]|nr:hypothetical protein [Anaerolineae bacterium]
MTAPILTFPSPTTQGIEAVAPEPPEEGIYPHSWDFAYGSAGWGNAIRLYSALTPWLGAETATGFQMNSMRAELHDGWNGNFGTGQSQQFPPVLTSAFAPPSVAAGWPTPRNYGDRMRVQNGAFCTPSIGGWCGQDNKIAVYRGNDTESSYDFNSGTGSFAVGETATASISGATVTFSTAVSGATGSALVRVESGPLVLGDVISGGGNSHTINSSLNLTPFAHLDWQAELWAFLVPSNGNQVLDWNASQWLQFNGVHGAGGFWSTISAPNQLPHTPGVGPRVATGYNNGVLGPDTNFDIYQWVQALEEVGDVEVAQDFIMSRLDGQVVPEARVFPFAGLGARIRGGNWNSPASAFGGLSLCDGYFVYLQNDWNADPLDWQWVLIRCNSGTVTQLDERPDLLGVNRAAETQATSINDLGLLSGTRKVRLRVTGTSPVRIEVWTTPRLTTIGQAFPGGGGFDPQ